MNEKGIITEEYYSAPASSAKKRMLVYTPPGYDGKKLPVLYLLHGIGQTEESWTEKCGAAEVFDEAVLSGAAEPFFAVMPNGRASEGGGIPGEKFGLEHIRVFMDFEAELMSCVMPFVEARYNIDAKRERRAVTGFSMGGYQSVNFGLTHLDKFAYIGGFAPAPAVDPESCAAEFLKDNGGADLKKLIKLFYITNGTEETGGEGIFGEFAVYGRRCAEFAERAGLEFTYRTFDGGHEPRVWKESLRDFAGRLWK